MLVVAVSAYILKCYNEFSQQMLLITPQRPFGTSSASHHILKRLLQIASINIVMPQWMPCSTCYRIAEFAQYRRWRSHLRAGKSLDFDDPYSPHHD